MYFFLLIATLLVAANASPTPLSSRVYDGKDSSIEDFPYQVSIEYLGSHTCGGSIINEHYIVTAGHCVSSSASYLKIRSGTDLRGKGGSLHQVEKIIRHENYIIKSNGVPVNDIALMRVKEPFALGKTRRPIDLFSSGEKSTPGKMANVSGFGWIRGNYSPTRLQSVEVPLVSYEVCDKAYSESYGGVPEGFICASWFKEGGKNACKGDSGGPLTVDGRLAGIVSWSLLCAQPGYPTVYTDVAYYRNWVDQHVQYS